MLITNQRKGEDSYLGQGSRSARVRVGEGRISGALLKEKKNTRRICLDGKRLGTSGFVMLTGRGVIRV